MDNYGKCKDCEYGEPESGIWKWNCTWYKTLEDPDKVRDCAHYRERDSGSGGCFLTTACCAYKGLPDDCYELETMRRFRDGYLVGQPYSEQQIHDYYAEAPGIVEKINQSPERDEILKTMYEKIRAIVALVDAGKNDEAVIYYMMLLHGASKIG